MVARELARQSSIPVAWLRMDPRFSDRGSFLTALLSAFEAALPDRFLPPLGAEDIAFAEAYLRRLLEAALKDDSHLLLIVDDMHVVGEESDPSGLLAATVKEFLPRLQVVLATRATPDRNWAWYGANNLDTVVSFNDLKLSAEEAGDLILAHAPEQVASPWQANALVAASGGWILGARLLLRYGVRNHGHITGTVIDKADGRILDLVEQEILVPLNKEELTIIVGAAMLPDLTIPLLATALGREFPEAVVERVVNKTLFVETSSSGRLQAHDLLKAAVKRSGLVDTPKEFLLEAGARAGDALIRSGDIRSGLSLLASVEAWEALRMALLHEAPRLGEGGESGVLLSVLEAMPEAILNQDIATRYWHGVSLLNLDPHRARRLLTDTYAQAKAERNTDYIIPIWAALVDAIWLEWVDCTLFDPLIDDIPWLESVADRLDSEEQRALLARGAFAALSFRRPEAPDFPQWEQRNLSYFWKMMPRHEAIRRGIQLMFRYCWGDGERLKADQVRTRLNYIFNEEAAAPADVCTRHVVSTEFMTIFEPDSAAVIRNVEEGLAATARHQLFFWDGPMLNAALYKVMSLEDRQRGRHYLDLLLSRLGPHSRPHDVAFYEHFSGYDRWLDGDHEAALNHARTAYQTSLDSGFSISPVYYGVALAAIEQTIGHRREALRHVRRARRIASAQRSYILVFISFLRGAALAVVGRKLRKEAMHWPQ